MGLLPPYLDVVGANQTGHVEDRLRPFSANSEKLSYDVTQTRPVSAGT